MGLHVIKSKGFMGFDHVTDSIHIPIKVKE